MKCEKAVDKTGNHSSADPSELKESEFLCTLLYVVVRILTIEDITLRRLPLF